MSALRKLCLEETRRAMKDAPKHRRREYCELLMELNKGRKNLSPDTLYRPSYSEQAHVKQDRIREAYQAAVKEVTQANMISKVPNDPFLIDRHFKRFLS